MMLDAAATAAVTADLIALGRVFDRDWLREHGAIDRFGTWLMVLGLYDLIFGLVGYAVFDFLLED